MLAEWQLLRRSARGRAPRSRWRMSSVAMLLNQPWPSRSSCVFTKLGARLVSFPSPSTPTSKIDQHNHNLRSELHHDPRLPRLLIFCCFCFSTKSMKLWMEKIMQSSPAFRTYKDAQSGRIQFENFNHSCSGEGPLSHEVGDHRCCRNVTVFHVRWHPYSSGTSGKDSKTACNQTKMANEPGWCRWLHFAIP